jgi:Uma2 family endonuclease
MAHPKSGQLTPEEYLARERVAESKSEYFAGEIFAMTGGSRSHSTICVHLIGECRNRLSSAGGCEVHTSDLRVKSASTGLYTYPDVTIACGELQFDDSHKDTLTNPTVIFEVLSPSTEAYDRGRKFEHYARIPSLRHYVLVDQFRAHVDLLSLEDGKWTITAADGLDATLTLAAIDLELPLREIYRQVEFPAGDSPRPPQA